MRERLGCLVITKPLCQVVHGGFALIWGLPFIAWQLFTVFGGDVACDKYEIR